MGSRGPLPLPYARRRNRKPNRGKRIEVGQPEPPKRLGGEALAEWERVAPELEGMGILAVIDRSILVRYCRTWADWLRIDAKLEKAAPVVKGRRNPLYTIRSELEGTLSDLGKQLGLTPVARLRAGVEHEQPQQETAVAPAAIADYRKRLVGK